jgi:hypothetical protein
LHKRKEKRRLEGAPFFVFDEEAGVFDYEEAGGAGFGGGFGAGNSQLEPEGFGMDGDRGIGDGRNFFGAAKDVDDVDGKWNVFEASVGFLAKDLGFIGINGNDGVAGGLEIGSDFVGGAAGIGREADDGDGFGGAEEIGNGVGSGGRDGREMDLHVYLMNERAKSNRGVRCGRRGR